MAYWSCSGKELKYTMLEHNALTKPKMLFVPKKRIYYGEQLTDRNGFVYKPNTIDDGMSAWSVHISWITFSDPFFACWRWKTGWNIFSNDFTVLWKLYEQRKFVYVGIIVQKLANLSKQNQAQLSQVITNNALAKSHNK